MKRGWQIFAASRLSHYGAIFLLTLTFLSVTAELWSNNRPLVLVHNARIYFPLVQDIQEDVHDFAIWPLNRWGPLDINKNVTEVPARPSAQNYFGTDDRGRDVLARLLYGFRYSLVFALLVWFGSSSLALLYGGLCGYLGGWVDLLGQRLSEILLTVPPLMLLLFAVSIFEPSLTMLVLVSCAFGWIGLSFLVRGEVLRVRALPYVEAAQALGASHTHILRRYVLPNCLLSLITLAPMVITGNITALAGLDYLGLGLPPPAPSWGELMQQAQTYFTYAGWLAVFPAVLLFLTLLSLSFVAEGLRRALDPLNQLAPAQKTSGRLVRKLAFVTVTVTGVFPSPAVATTAERAEIRLESEVVAPSAHPDEDSFNLQTFSASASGNSQFRMNKISYRHTPRRGLVNNLSLNVDLIKAHDPSLDMQGQRTVGAVEVGVGKVGRLTASGGANRTSDFKFRDDRQMESKQTVVYGLEYYAHRDNKWELTLNTGHDALYADWVNPYAAVLDLRGTRYFARFEVLPWERVHLRSAGQYTKLNDQNESRETDQSVMIETFHGRVNSMLGLGFWYLKFLRDADYWAPPQFYKYELRSENYFTINKSWGGGANVNFGRGNQLYGSQGWDGFFETHLTYSATSSMQINLGWSRMLALRSGGNWERTDLNLSLSAAL